MSMVLPQYDDPPFACPPDVVISLPMPPTTNNLFAGKGRRYRTAVYEDWIEDAGWRLKAQRPAPLPGKVTLLIEVSLRESQDNWDVSNREKATVDLLVSHDIIQGDNRPYVREVTMRWAEVEGVRVTIRGCE